MKKIFIAILFLFLGVISGISKDILPDNYNVVWKSQSKNSSESMPLGGGDIGCNVWVEEGNILLYIAQSGNFDENNEMLKSGRLRIHLSPNPFLKGDFSQELKLEEGSIEIKAKNAENEAKIKLWVDVFHPVVYADIECNIPTTVTATYENWRYQDVELRKYESFGNSYKWAPPKGLKILKDSIRFEDNNVVFYHQVKPNTVFDVTVEQQGLNEVKGQLYNPLHNLVFGGILTGNGFVAGKVYKGKYLDTPYKAWSIKSKKAQKQQSISLVLNRGYYYHISDWEEELTKSASQALQDKNNNELATQKWWKEFWERSFVFIESENSDDSLINWQVGRNYQLFRYMLGCNAYGSYPTKFNGGLFTYDPCFVNNQRCFTPDFRNWGGGTFTAQNQRLVYFPLLKSGDFDLMQPQLNFYLKLQKNAELRSQYYWGHKGACFTEQLENFGLPNPSEYGWKRPDWYDKGLQYNAWLEYQWDTSLEFCLMMLQLQSYAGYDISKYINFIVSCLRFFDEHYQYLAEQRGSKALDENGKLVLYPGSSCETYKMAYNATSTVAALSTVTNKIIELPDGYISDSVKNYLVELQKRIPPISYREIEGKTCIAPALVWQRLNNTECPQLYPVYPWGIYGVGKPGLDTAINTYTYDPDAIKFRSYKGWKQDNIFAARLGLTDEAWYYTSEKLKNSGRRFPAFWGPGFDWVPDHNWGGSGMIGLQEILVQTSKDSIYLLPAWPKDIDVHFKLHIEKNTTIEVDYKDGKVDIISVVPGERLKDIVIE